jgi:photosystem II stability/assembly factor-like uncharacterized protein
MVTTAQVVRFGLLAAVGAAIALAARDTARDTRTNRFGHDSPDAAAAYERARRAPIARGIDTVALYERAEIRRLRMPRFSSSRGRTLPGSQPPSRVWVAGAGVVSLGRAASPTAVLDAWTPLGPGNIGGRTRVVRYHPTQHDTLFAAGVSGGIWRSDDNGGSWRPIADGLTNLAVNAFAIDRSEPDVMYAGTGEGYLREEIRGTGLPLRGGGIFVTRDGGTSWTRLASTANDDFLWVNDLELGVGDSRRIYAATRTGVWRSADAGETWTRMLETTVRAGCLDLAIRPDDRDDVLFAACGSYEQAAVYRFPRASRSSDNETVLSEPGMGRTSLAIAPSRPDVIYALSASNDPGPGENYRQGLLAVYRSDRGGVSGSWQPRVTNTNSVKLSTLLLTNSPAAMVEACAFPNRRDNYTNMGWYNNVIAVDPRDPERVWAAGVDWFRSDDGGRSWGIASYMGAPGTNVAYAHVDQHAITFHPDYDGGDNQIALIGNDGGVFRTKNARGQTVTDLRTYCTALSTSIRVGWESLNHGYGVTQFYYGLPFPDGARYLGGTQDNGTPFGNDEAGADGWRMTIGGDGGYVAVHPTDPLVYYGESQWANVARTIDGGVRFTSATRGLDLVRSDTLGPEANYLFVSPFVMDPSNPQRLWLGGEFLYRTNDGAVLWTKASTAMPEGGLVSSIAVAASDANRVVAGTHNGYVVSSRSASSATADTEWSASQPRTGWMTSVAFDATNASVVYATYGTFGGSHVFRSADGGATWAALDGDGESALPDIPVHCIAVDPNDSDRLYIGTDAGVFVSIDRGRGWMIEETGFGPAVTEWLSFLRDASGRSLLFAFTHGRGAWRVEVR